MQYAPLDQLIGKTVVIVGLGVEGRSTFEFIRSQAFETKIILVDQKPLAELPAFWHEALAQDSVELRQPTTLLDLRDAQTAVVFKTPGIPVSYPFVQHALQHGAQLLSNTQLFFELVDSYNHTRGHRELVTIGVTGTKGKSTTTSFIHHVLVSASKHSYLGGNIGKPALELWQQWESNQVMPAYFVLELSAHQLAELPYSPFIAVVQAITPEHLDYYRNFEEYLHAKSGITRYQTAACTVLFNADSETARQLADLSPGHKVPFSAKNNQPPLDQSLVNLPGKHNLNNILPAVLLSQLLQIPGEKVLSAISSFMSLPHRLELVGEVNGVRYYDDSIATTPEAAMAAMEAFPDTGIILLAGGHDRHLDYNELAHAITNANVKAVALFPPTGKQLHQALSTISSQSMPVVRSVQTMTEAVAFAAEQAQSGDVVLLSPAAASFGMFKDYQDRGDQFKEAVQRLK